MTPGSERLMTGVARQAIFLVLLAVYGAGLAVSPAFADAHYVFNVLRQVAPLGIASVGVTLVMILGGVDLSVGAVISLTTVLTAMTMAGDAANLPFAICSPARWVWASDSSTDCSLRSIACRRSF